MADRIIKQHMGASHKEFFRLLPVALGSDEFTAQGTQIVYAFGDKRIEINLGPEGERRIALLTIPTTNVEIHASGFDDIEFERFMANFERAYQRGGG